MRKLLLILLLASPCLAGGPKWNYSDPKLNDEMGNIYKDIPNVLKGNVRISSVTIGTMTASSISVASMTVSNSLTFGGGSTQTVSGQFGRLVQVVTTTSTASTTSVGTAYTVTPSSATINLKIPGDFVKVSISNCTLGNNSVNTSNVIASLFRNSVDTAPGGNGFCAIADGTLVGATSGPCSMTYTDYPTTGTSYAVFIKSTAAAQAQWGGIGTMCVVEIDEYTVPNGQ